MKLIGTQTQQAASMVESQGAESTETVTGRLQSNLKSFVHDQSCPEHRVIMELYLKNLDSLEPIKII